MPAPRVLSAYSIETIPRARRLSSKQLPGLRMIRPHVRPGYELVPEVEQTHDPAMNGAAIVFRVERITGTYPLGPVLVEEGPD